VCEQHGVAQLEHNCHQDHPEALQAHVDARMENAEIRVQAVEHLGARVAVAGLALQRGVADVAAAGQRAGAAVVRGGRELEREERAERPLRRM